MMRKFTTIIIFLLVATMGFSQSKLTEKQLQAIDILKQSTDSTNWKIKDVEKLKERKTSPNISFGSQYSNRGLVLDLSNNNLNGEINTEFVYKDGEFAFNYETEFKLSWNNIRKVSPVVGHNAYTSYCKRLMLDHNDLTSVYFYNTRELRQVTGKSSGYGLYTGCKVFMINNNEITELKKNNLGDYGSICTVLDNKAEIIRIDNNRLDFESLCDVVPYIKTVFSKISHYAEGNPNCIFTYYPQKALGDDYEAKQLDAGSQVDLSFTLSHSKNVYTWQLNGKDIPLSKTKNYQFTLSEENAGVYRCKITNPELPEVTLYSKDMPVFVNKTDNQATANIELDHNAINANFPRLTIVGDLVAEDPDGDEVFFRLPEKIGNNSSFRIKDGKTLISAEELFDRDFIESYEIVVEAYDKYGGTFEKTIVLEKGESNDTSTPLPSNITLSANSIEENLANTKIGFFTAIGVEGYSFSLPEGVKDNGSFKVAGDSLFTTLPLNYEEKSSYQIRLKASATDGTNMLKEFTINVINVNDNPHEIILTNKQVKVNQTAGALVGYLAAADQDENDKQFTFELAADSENIDNELFVIEGNTLKTKQKFTQEQIGTKTVSVTAKDQHEGSYTIEIEIEIVGEDAIGNIEQNLILSSNTVPENSAANTVIGTLKVKGNNGQDFVYSIVEEADHALFSIEANQLKIKTSPNFEERAKYLVKIQAKAGEVVLNLSQNIFVTNVNEAPVFVGLTNTLLPADATVNSVLGTLVVEDPDGFDSFTFELENTELFRIEGKKIVLNAEVPTSKTKENLQIKVTDKGGLSYKQTLAVTFETKSEPVVTPETTPQVQLTNNKLAENSAANSTIGTIKVVDNNGENFAFELLDEGDADAFIIENDVLKMKAVPNFESKSHYQITIQAKSEKHTLKLNQTICITNQNEAPTAIGLTNTWLKQNAAVNSEVCTVLVEDPDGFDSFTIELENTNLFRVEGKKIVLNAEVPSSKTKENLQIKVTDKGGLSYKQTLTVTFESKSETVVTPETTPQVQLTNNKLAENSATNSTIGTIKVVDNNGENFAFELLDEGDADAFMIENDVLKMKAVPNFESKAHYQIAIQAKSEKHTLKLNQTICITNQNEAPTAIGLTNTWLKQNAAVNSEFCTVVVDDQDGNDNCTLTIENTELFRVDGNKLFINTTLPTNESFIDVQIKATDKGGLEYAQSVRVNIEAQAITNATLSVSTQSVKSDAAVGSTVATFSLENANENYSFSVSNSLFEVSGNNIVNTGVLAQPYYVVTLTATSANQTITKDVLVAVEQVNMAPTRIGLDNFLLKNDWPLETSVATLFMKDANGDRPSFELLAGTDNFRIEGDQLIVTALTNDDVYKITVKASDGKESVTQEFSLFIPVIVSGVDHINQNDIDAKLFPNPVNDILNTTQNGNIAIYSSNGVMVKYGSIQNSMDVSELKPGVYTVILQTNDGNKSFKIIKN